MSLEARLLAVADLSASERVDLIVHLVESWYGPPVPGDRPDIAVGLPSTLRLFHAKIGGSLPRICRQNTLLRPGDVYESDELLVIALENQGVYAWATRAMEDDPPIFGCFQGDEPWTREDSSLSAFLLGFVVFELIMGAPYGASAAGLGEGALEAVLAHMAPLSLPAWRWPDEPGRFFVRGQAFAFCAPDSPDTVSLWVGGRAPGDVAFLAPFVEPDWNRVAL